MTAHSGSWSFLCGLLLSLALLPALAEDLATTRLDRRTEKIWQEAIRIEDSDSARARTLLAEVILAAPGYVPAWQYRARLEYADGHYDNAIKALDRALESTGPMLNHTVCAATASVSSIASMTPSPTILGRFP